MKKIILLSVFAITSVSFANNAPMMRGEYTAVAPNGVNILTHPIANLPVPSVSISSVVRTPTILIPADTKSTMMIDSTLIDDFIADIAPNARHYPPNFPNRTARYYTAENIKYLSTWLQDYANNPDASIDVLIRAAKINAMGRNLDMGIDYATRANSYVERILKSHPDHTEGNFLYGMMLSEGGGFKEGKKYLEKAARFGMIEAEQSLAQSDLLSDNKSAALSRLKKLQNQHPNNTQITEQITIIQNGGYYIWDIKDNDINVKPINRP